MSIQFLKMRRPVRPSFAAAQLMTTEVVRSGYLPAKTIAIIPPIEVPWTWARSIPSASMSAARSSAHTSMSYCWRGLSDARSRACRSRRPGSGVGERRGHGVEVEVPEAGAVDLDHGLALAGDPVPEASAVDLGRSLAPPPGSASRASSIFTMSDMVRYAFVNVISTVSGSVAASSRRKLSASRMPVLRQHVADEPEARRLLRRTGTDRCRIRHGPAGSSESAVRRPRSRRARARACRARPASTSRRQKESERRS